MRSVHFKFAPDEEVVYIQNEQWGIGIVTLCNFSYGEDYQYITYEVYFPDKKFKTIIKEENLTGIKA